MDHQNKKVKKNIKRKFPSLQSSLVFSDPRVWKTVAESRLLTSQELGRLLLKTSKSITTTACHDENRDDLWKLLCMNHWGSEKAATMMQVTEMTAEDCFRKLAHPPKKDDTTSPPPLKYAPNDYVVIVDVRNKHDQLIFCEVLKGEDIPDFFEKGECKVEFQRPIEEYISFESSTFESLQELYDSLPVDTEEWKGTVRVMRRPDRKVIQLLGFESRTESIHPPEWPKDDDPENMLWGDTNWMLHESSVTGLYGQDLMGQLGYDLMGQLGYEIDNMMSGLGGLEVELDLDYRATLSTEKAAIDVFGFQLNVLAWYDGIGSSLSELLQGKDLQFAHFLEAFHEWDEQA